LRTTLAGRGRDGNDDRYWGEISLASAENVRVGGRPGRSLPDHPQPKMGSKKW